MVTIVHVLRTLSQGDIMMILVTMRAMIGDQTLASVSQDTGAGVHHPGPHPNTQGTVTLSVDILFRFLSLCMLLLWSYKGIMYEF